MRRLSPLFRSFALQLLTSLTLPFVVACGAGWRSEHNVFDCHFDVMFVHNEQFSKCVGSAWLPDVQVSNLSLSVSLLSVDLVCACKLSMVLFRPVA